MNDAQILITSGVVIIFTLLIDIMKTNLGNVRINISVNNKLSTKDFVFGFIAVSIILLGMVI